MDVVFRVWQSNYYGFGVEGNPDAAVVKHFRSTVRKELGLFNARVEATRKKHCPPKKEPAPRITDASQKDYFNMESAKLLNGRTCNKNICPRRSAGARRVPLKVRTSCSPEYDVSKWTLTRDSTVSTTSTRRALRMSWIRMTWRSRTITIGTNTIMIMCENA